MEKKRLADLKTGETISQKDAYLQVGKYLLEQFSIPAFRSHATIGLVDRDRIQFYHANHSVILVSSAINFSGRDGNSGLDKFIAIVIAFSRLSLSDNGILHNLHDGKLFRTTKSYPTSNHKPRGHTDPGQETSWSLKERGDGGAVHAHVRRGYLSRAIAGRTIDGSAAREVSKVGRINLVVKDQLARH
jgi:hypothetical protein